MTILRAHVLKKNPPRAIFRSRSWLECAWQHSPTRFSLSSAQACCASFRESQHGAGVMRDTALDCLPQATAASPPPFCSLLTFCPTQRAASITASRPTAARRLPPPQWHHRPAIVRMQDADRSSSWALAGPDHRARQAGRQLRLFCQQHLSVRSATMSVRNNA